MFQSFEETSDPARAAERVAQLRNALAQAGVDGFLVPRSDEHQGEYVAASAERLRWLTGFSGSAGSALILPDRAVIFVDGRYTLQVRDQTDGTVFTYEDLVKCPPAKWLPTNLSKGLKIGFDPWLHTVRDVRSLRDAVEKAGAELVALDINPIDIIWHDRPSAPLGQVAIHEDRFAGVAANEKLATLEKEVKESGAAYLVMTDPASIAWAFNIRGSDIPHIPVALGFAIIASHKKPLLYLDKRKLDEKATAYLAEIAALCPPGELIKDLASLAADGSIIALDPQLAAEKIRMVVEDNGGKVVKVSDPALLPRATKNAAEISGAQDAHRRDGAAMAEFLCWLHAQKPGTVDEISAASKLEECRRSVGERTQMPLRDISFDTISGAGPNGAIIHYRVTRRTNRVLEPGSLYLVDSGAQFNDGTTDVTRTIAVGEPDDKMRQHYTLVLIGLIKLSMLRFPEGTRGSDIDAVARLALWAAGLDYAHGTGHGVGSFLSVHEGPQRLSRTGMQVLLPGMILSNEPGYYREGRYGIRLENLIVVQKAAAIEGGEIDMLGFETLTLVPFDRRLIDVGLLSEHERIWINRYHRRVEAEIGPMLAEFERGWLAESCRPL